MKFRILLTSIVLCLVIILTGGLYAQDTTRTEESSQTKEKTQEQLKHNQHFIDENGDGYNDNAPDHDGDGIPNGLDPDWQKLKAKKGKKGNRRYIDLDGDGINDNLESGSEKEDIEGGLLNKQKNGSSIDSKSKQDPGQQKKRQRGKD